MDSFFLLLRFGFLHCLNTPTIALLPLKRMSDNKQSGVIFLHHNLAQLPTGGFWSYDLGLLIRLPENHKNHIQDIRARYCLSALSILTEETDFPTSVTFLLQHQQAGKYSWSMWWKLPCTLGTTGTFAPVNTKTWFYTKSR